MLGVSPTELNAQLSAAVFAAKQGVLSGREMPSLVIFDSNGTPSFIANNCPHRGASLFFGRNEETGLRCVYHGWKFDASGQCVDMPNEPAESDFKTKVSAVTYRGADAGGITSFRSEAG